MEVRHDEGVANRIGPEPCALSREAEGEASAGGVQAMAMSRERTHWGADAVRPAEGETVVSVRREHTTGPTWSKTMACPQASCTGTGRSLA